MALTIKPIQHAEACKFINLYHRHNVAPQGCKWNIGCYNGDILVGVAIAGRPVARYLDDGLTIEITRVCTDGTRNACSKLYGACVQIAKAMGYKKVITYILSSEDGASVKASNFVLAEKSAGGGSWNCNARARRDYPVSQTNLFGEKKHFTNEVKQRYEYRIN